MLKALKYAQYHGSKKIRELCSEIIEDVVAVMLRITATSTTTQY
jgi:hypothetical protein